MTNSILQFPSPRVNLLSANGGTDQVDLPLQQSPRASRVPTLRLPESFWPDHQPVDDLRTPLPVLLQGLFDALREGVLNPVHHTQWMADFCDLAVRCYCEGAVGPGRGIEVVLAGKAVQLDAVDLSRLIDAIGHQMPTWPALIDLVEANTGQNARTVPLKNPKQQVLDNCRLRGLNCFGMGIVHQNANRLDGQLSRLLAQPFDKATAECAKQVIACLPLAAQGDLRDIPAQCLGQHVFVQLMREAAKNNLLPPPVQHFRDSCGSAPWLKTALYRNPWIAARLLGLPVAASKPSLTDSQLVDHVMRQAKITTEDLVSGDSRHSSLFRLPGWGSGLKQLVKTIHQALSRSPTLHALEQTAAPSCFPDIQCPAHSAVQLQQGGDSGLAPVHANWVPMGSHRRAIAAMQPVHKPNDDPENLTRFFRLLALQPNTTVLDLRSDRDFKQGAFDYIPPVGQTLQLASRHRDSSVTVTTLSSKVEEDSPYSETQIQVQVGQEPPKLIQVLQFRRWPDQGVVSSNKLRALRLAIQPALESTSNLITHCRAGVGRTGTVLVYARLYHELIELGGAQALRNPKGKVNHHALLNAVTKAIVEGRLHRGPHFVQTPEQMELIAKTLAEDIENAALPVPIKASSQTPVPVQVTDRAQIQAPTNLPDFAQRVCLQGRAPAIFSPEPKAQSLMHWQAIFDQGKSVAEVISDPLRAIGANPQSPHGLASGLGQWLTAQALPTPIDVGDHQITGIRRLDSPAPPSGSHAGMNTQVFEIEYTTRGHSEPQTVKFTQILTPFDGRKLLAEQLHGIVECLSEADMHQETWITSVVGKGRPSAIVTAQALQKAILQGGIKSENELVTQLDQWIEQGRKMIGAMFIHTPDQREQLLVYGRGLLSSNKNKVA